MPGCKEIIFDGMIIGENAAEAYIIELCGKEARLMPWLMAACATTSVISCGARSADIGDEHASP